MKNKRNEIFNNILFSQNIDTLYTNCSYVFEAEDPKTTKQSKNGNSLFYFENFKMKSLINVYIDDSLVKENLIFDTNGDLKLLFKCDLRKKGNFPHRITIYEVNTKNCIQFYSDSRFSCYFLYYNFKDDGAIRPCWNVNMGSCDFERE